MRDDKRLLRQIKREIKKTGNRKRRRYLKNPEADASAFQFGDDSSTFLNEPRRDRRDVPDGSDRGGHE